MIAATRSMLWGVLIGGPIAVIGFFVFLSSLHDLPFWNTKEQLKAWGRSPKCVGGLVALFVGLIIVLISMIPMLSI